MAMMTMAVPMGTVNVHNEEADDDDDENDDKNANRLEEQQHVFITGMSKQELQMNACAVLPWCCETIGRKAISCCDCCPTVKFRTL